MVKNLFMSIVAGGLMIGCSASKKLSDNAKETGFDPAGATLVAQGRPPLSFLISESGTLTVLDLTANEMKHRMDLPEDMNGSSALLVIDGVRGGAYITPLDTGEEVILLNTIDPKHRFAIYFDEDDDDDEDDHKGHDHMDEHAGHEHAATSRPTTQASH